MVKVVPYSDRFRLAVLLFSVFTSGGILYILAATVVGNDISGVQRLTDSDWEKMLYGEWLIKFYAPWCPACQSLAPVWENLGRQAADMGIKVADVDVTENAALSGRFFVTSLPTIYHAKDGVFRQYKRSRTESDLISFVVDRKWAEVEPLPWYQAPDSYPMKVVGLFFQGSIAIRNLHTSVTTEYGVPVWVSYIMIAVITLVVGLVLGLCCVCMCDMCGSHTASETQLAVDDDVNDDVVDDDDDDNIVGKNDGAGDKKSLSENSAKDDYEDDDGELSGVDDRENAQGGEQLNSRAEHSGGGGAAARRRNIPQ